MLWTKISTKFPYRIILVQLRVSLFKKYTEKKELEKSLINFKSLWGEQL